jgi:hypothetical protein
MSPYFDRDEAAALAVHGAQAAPSFDRRAVESHVSLIHDLAEGQDGVLILAAFEEGGQPNVQRFRIGDVANMVETIMGFEGHPRVNLYIPWAVMRRDLEPGRKGTEADVVAILAAVPDLDGDKGVKTELPVEAPYIVESSPGNFQPVYIFERPLAPADAKPALTALCDFVGGDSGTKDCSHVWRIPGTLNIPTKSKLARGRSSVPAPVMEGSSARRHCWRWLSRRGCQTATIRRRPVNDHSPKRRGFAPRWRRYRPRTGTFGSR